MALAKNSNLTKEMDDSFLTCVEACVTICTLAELPKGELLTWAPDLFDAFAKVWNTKNEDIPEDVYLDVMALKGIIAEAMGVGYENYGSGPWPQV